MCLDTLQWKPVFVPICCHYLMAGCFCKCFCNFGFICMFNFHCPSVWLTTDFCFGPIPAFQVNRPLSGSVYILCISVCLSNLSIMCPQNLGPSVLAGVALMILLIPLNGAVAVKMRAFQVGARRLSCSNLEPWRGAWCRAVTTWALSTTLLTEYRWL